MPSRRKRVAVDGKQFGDQTLDQMKLIFSENNQRYTLKQYTVILYLLKYWAKFQLMPRILGSQDPRIIRSQDYQILGLLDPRIVGSQDCWILGLQDPRIVGSQDCWILGLLDPRIVGSQDCWILGLTDPRIVSSQYCTILRFLILGFLNRYVIEYQ